MDDRLKRWPTLPRRDPCVLLRELLEVIAKGARHGIKRDLILLRGPKQKKSREIFQACIFLCAVRQASGKPYRLIHEEPENSPVDVVAVIDLLEERASYYYPIQLKELPPRSRNPNISLDDLLRDLASDTSIADSIVAVYLNREFRLVFDAIAVPPGLKARQLWLYGSPGPPANFILRGDLMEANPATYEVTLPLT